MDVWQGSMISASLTCRVRELLQGAVLCIVGGVSTSLTSTTDALATPLLWSLQSDIPNCPLRAKSPLGENHLYMWTLKKKQGEGMKEKGSIGGSILAGERVYQDEAENTEKIRWEASGLKLPHEDKRNLLRVTWQSKDEGVWGLKKSWKERYRDVSKSILGKELSTARGRQGKIFPKHCQRLACPKVCDSWQITAVL